MDKETKDIIKPLVESLVSVVEKQALVLQLLASKLPDLSGDEKRKLQDSAQVNLKSAETWRLSLKDWK